MVSIVLFLLCLTLPLLILLFFHKHRSTKNPPTPPGPRGLPIIGNLHQLNNPSTLHLQLWQLSKIYGPLFSLQLGLRPAVVVSSPKLAKEILKNHGLVFSGRPSLLGQQKLSYNGIEMIFSPYSDYWREIRKICIVHIFSSKRVSCFSSIRHYEVKQMIKKISRHASNSTVTNLSELLISLSSTIICRIAFGRRYEDEGTEKSRFQALLNEDILVAATDTTAATSVWAMTALIKNPRVMKTVQEEIRKFGDKKDFIGEDDIQKLPYLKAVIKETLRLHLPAPLLVPREANENCIIDGYQIQAKTIVYVNGWAIHRDPEAWKDPEEFYPERFLDSAIDFQGQDFELIPFGAGRRICPGLAMAVPTLELIIANLLHSFDWELPPGLKKEDIDTEVLPGITIHKKNPLYLFAKNHI